MTINGFKVQGLQKLLRMPKVWKKGRKFDCKTCFFYKHKKQLHSFFFSF